MKVKSSIILTLLAGLQLTSLAAVAANQCFHWQGRWVGEFTSQSYNIYPVSLKISCDNNNHVRGYIMYRCSKRAPSATRLWGRLNGSGKFLYLENKRYIYGTDLSVELQAADTLKVKSFNTSVFGLSTIKEGRGSLKKSR